MLLMLLWLFVIESSGGRCKSLIENRVIKFWELLIGRRDDILVELGALLGLPLGLLYRPFNRLGLFRTISVSRGVRGLSPAPNCFPCKVITGELNNLFSQLEISDISSLSLSTFDPPL